MIAIALMLFAGVSGVSPQYRGCVWRLQFCDIQEVGRQGIQDDSKEKDADRIHGGDDDLQDDDSTFGNDAD